MRIPARYVRSTSHSYSILITAPDQGVPPATVAEWTLQGDGNADWYDVSLVDGFNVPMSVVPASSSCHQASCPVDLDPNCPAELASAGGCKSACFANLDGNQADSPNCCSGSHNTAATCPPSGVAFYDYFSTWTFV
jgi:hypothetical protein